MISGNPAIKMKNAELELYGTHHTTTPPTTPPRPFSGPFSGTIRVSQYDKRTSGLHGANAKED